MYHFKVLPTDPKYRSLNIVQKLALLYYINQKKEETVDYDLSLIDHLKPWINPSLWLRIEKGETEKRENVLYDQQILEMEKFRLQKARKETEVPKPVKVLHTSFSPPK